MTDAISYMTVSVSYLIKPVNTGRKLNVHKTFRRRPGRPRCLLDVLCTFNLRPVSAENCKWSS